MPSEYEPFESLPDDYLLREASNGNDDAFRQFCVRSMPSLLRYCEYQCRRSRIPSGASDFCQEAIQRALDYVSSCRDPGGRPLPKVSVAWLKQIAYNCIRDWVRKEKRVSFVDKFVGTLEREVPEEASLEEVEEQEKILKFFDWLRADDREILELVLVKEMSIVDAGESVGLSQDASYKAYQRALQRLQDLLVEHGLAPDIADIE